jgi:hypothetical protein
VCSAAAIVLPVGALTTVIPARVAASRSTLSTPTPARPMTTSRAPAEMSSASTWTWLRTMSASYSGRIAAELVAGAADVFVDLVVRREEIDALARDALGDEDLHALVPATDMLRMPLDASAARWAAATSRARLDRTAELDRDLLEQRERAEDLLDGHGAEVTEAEDPALELALATGQHEAAILECAVERLPVEAVGHRRGSHGPRVVTLVGEQLEAERGQTGARRRGACLVAGEDRLGAFLLHQPKALVDLEDDRDRRGERGLAVRGCCPMGTQVEVEAGHRGVFHRGPRPGRRRDHRQTRSRHPRLL